MRFELEFDGDAPPTPNLACLLDWLTDWLIDYLYTSAAPLISAWIKLWVSCWLVLAILKSCGYSADIYWSGEVSPKELEIFSCLIFRLWLLSHEDPWIVCWTLFWLSSVASKDPRIVNWAFFSLAIDNMAAVILAVVSHNFCFSHCIIIITDDFFFFLFLFFSFRTCVSLPALLLHERMGV